MAPVARLRLLAASCLALASLLAAAPARAADEVALTKVSYDEFQSRIANPPEGVKYTVVDAWATYCPPCMENFPHVVALQKKFDDKGLRCMSLTLDDVLETQDVAKAEKFLKQCKATFPNFIVDGNPADVYEALKISGIPAVFVFDAQGKEIRRFTMDDPDNQFTYDQVDEYVAGLLGGAPAK